MNLARKKSPQKTSPKPLSLKQKRTIDKAVKKTVKEYGKTLKLLAKT